MFYPLSSFQMESFSFHVISVNHSLRNASNIWKSGRSTVSIFFVVGAFKKRIRKRREKRENSEKRESSRWRSVFSEKKESSQRNTESSHRKGKENFWIAQGFCARSWRARGFRSRALGSQPRSQQRAASCSSLVCTSRWRSVFSKKKGVLFVF